MSTRDFQVDDKRRQAAHEPAAGVKGKSDLTQQAFEKLLTALSSNREEAGVTYEVIRRKLVRFFEWRAIDEAEERADETINRVARRIDEGQTVQNLQGYFYGVARLVLMEARKEQERASVALNEATYVIRETQPADTEPDARLKCFDQCLESLAPESHHLIMEYYREERRAKIELRQQLADRLSIPLNALRIRAHRIRVGLERCITACLQKPVKSTVR